MLSKEKILSNFYATLAELQHGVTREELRKHLQIKLDLLLDIVGDELDDDFVNQAEKALEN